MLFPFFITRQKSARISFNEERKEQRAVFSPGKPIFSWKPVNNGKSVSCLGASLSLMTWGSALANNREGAGLQLSRRFRRRAEEFPSSAMAPAVKRVSLTIDTKIKILAEVDRKVKSKSEIAKQYNLSSSSLSTILKNRGKIVKLNDNGCSKQRMRARDAKWPDLETALVEWGKQVRRNNVPIDGKLLRAKADDFALQMGIEKAKLSNGWFGRFLKRNKLTFRKLCGEKASADQGGCDEWRTGRLPELLEKYSADNIFNADETGLMYKMLPDRSLVFKGESSAGVKKAKQRITLLVAANMTGTDKLPLLVIGKSKKPRCFKGIKTLPVNYKNNENSWMTSAIFEQWVRELDQKMFLKKRKILLIIDNCTAHPVIENLRAVELEFLPPNATSILQPMDQGVIQCLKKHYRRMLLNRVVLNLDNGKKYDVDLLSAIHLASASWNSVSPETIQNCFKHAGFGSSEDSHPDEDETGDSDSVVKDLMCKAKAPNEVSFQDYVDVDIDVPCVEEKTDAEIVKGVLSAKSDEVLEEDSSSDEAEPSLPRPSLKDAVDSVELLRRFFESHENCDVFLKNLSELESGVFSLRKTKQSVMTDFFKE